MFRKNYHRALAAIAAPALAVAGAVSVSPTAHADVNDGHAYVVNSSASEAQARPVQNPERDAVYVVNRPVVEPAATVSRALADQPVHPHLAELHVGGSTIYIDPTKNYTRTRPGHIDENHSIVQAQQLYRRLTAEPARVLRNPNRSSSARPNQNIEPRAILRIKPPQPQPQSELWPELLVKSD